MDRAYISEALSHIATVDDPVERDKMADALAADLAAEYRASPEGQAIRAEIRAAAEERRRRRRG